MENEDHPNFHADLSLIFFFFFWGGGGRGVIIFHFLLCKIVSGRRPQIDTRTQGEVKLSYLFSLL